jgi:sarcosine oxidase, subunit beta
MAKLFDWDERQRERTDIAVIGGGIVGLAAAYVLASRGKTVSVLERRTVGWEASGRTAAGVRQQGRDPREIALAMAAVRLWGTLDRELQGETGYRRDGNVFVAMSGEGMARLEAQGARERAMGLEVELLTAPQLRARVAAVSDRCVGGKYCATDGVAEPALVITSLARAAERAGARVHQGAEVLDFVVEDRRVVSILTERAEFRPDVTVLAAGPWTALLAARLGVSVPIVPVRSQLMQTEPVGPVCKEFVIARELGVYCRPAPGGTMLVGGDYLRDELDPRTAGEGARRQISVCVPALATAPIHRVWSGLLDVTPDEVPLIGPVPGLRDCFMAAGFSGHGFCLGPMAGRLVAEWVAAGEPSLSLQALSPARFAGDAARAGGSGNEPDAL